MIAKLPIRSFLTGLGLVLLGAACSPERISAPAAAPTPSAGLLSSLTGLVSGTTSTLTKVPVVTRNTALSTDISVTQTIGSAGGGLAKPAPRRTVTFRAGGGSAPPPITLTAGGVISMPAAGLTVTFSAGAVSAPTAITVTAFAGNKVAYGFEPHGIQFSAPVVVTQNMLLTSIANNSYALSQVQAGYFPDGKSDLLSDGTALVNELLPVKLVIGTVTGLINSLLGVKVETASFVIRHFSGYLLCGA